MATDFNSNTYLSVYNDDYRDSDNYHRILFNTGRFVQARELTQLQTIIQSEVARIARFLFNEGSIINANFGTLATGDEAAHYVKLSTSLASIASYASIVGTTVTDGTLTALVLAAIPAASPDPDTLIVRYTDAGGATGVFAAGSTLTTDIGNLTVIGSSATGRSTIISVSQYDTFAGGHMIFVPAQSLVVSKYSATPTEVVGFKLNKEIYTVGDDIALYDNSGVNPNLTSPGADRLKISLTLTKESDISAGDTFFKLLEIVNGVVTVLQNQDNILSKLGDVLNARTHDITGSYVIPNGQGKKFDITLEVDSDNDYIKYRIDPGTAFINGARVNVPYSQTIRTLKPRTISTSGNPGDSKIQYNSKVPINYGNYFLGDSSTTGLITQISTLDKVYINNAVNYGGSVIGEARVRHVDKVGDDFRIHVFDVKMDSSGGVPYNITNARSLGTSVTKFSNLRPSIDGYYNLVDKNRSALLFPFNNQYVSNIELGGSNDITAQLRKVTTGTVSSGSVTITAGAGETFVNSEDWIVENDSSGALYTNLGVNTGTGQITGIGADGASHILYFVEKNITSVISKTKTNVLSQSVTMSNGRFTLPHHDIYQFDSVSDSNGNNIIGLFNLDNGQRDGYYDFGGGTLKPENSTPSDGFAVSVSYSYFAHGSGDLFNVESYSLDYENIPTYTSKNTGRTYRLSDVLDFRSKKGTDGTFTDSDAVILNIPENTYVANVDEVGFWRGRRDNISLAPSGRIEHKIGTSPDTLPTTPVGNLSLYNMTLNPYTFTNADIRLSSINNKGYKMSDIRSLERRLSNVEDKANLNAAEISQLKANVPDPVSGNPDRLKIGLTSDTFINSSKSDVYNPNYRSKVVTGSYVLRPYFINRAIGFEYDSDESVSVQNVGGVVLPTYDEEAYISQTQASSGTNVVRFELSHTVGSINLEPNADYWNLRETVSAAAISALSQDTFIPVNSSYINSHGAQASTATVYSDNQFEEVIGYGRISVCRPRFIWFKVTGLMPNTQHYVYFDGTNVTKWINTSYNRDTFRSRQVSGDPFLDAGETYVGQTAFPSAEGGPTAASGPLTSSSTGSIEGVFYLQSNVGVNFSTGVKQFIVMDTSTIDYANAQSYAMTTYSALAQYTYTQATTSPPTTSRDSGNATVAESPAGAGNPVVELVQQDTPQTEWSEYCLVLDPESGQYYEKKCSYDDNESQSDPGEF